MKKSLQEMMEILEASGVDTRKFNIDINVNVNIEEPKTEKPEPETKGTVISKDYLKTQDADDNIAIATIRSVNGLYYDKKRMVWLKGLNGLYKTMRDKDFERWVYYINHNQTIAEWLKEHDSPLYEATGISRENLQAYNVVSIADEFKGVMAYITLRWMYLNMNAVIVKKVRDIFYKNTNNMKENKWKLYADLVKLVKEEGIVIEI